MTEQTAPMGQIGVPIPTVPDTSPPTRIIYREIDIDIDKTKFKINVIYRLPHNQPKYDDIDNFITRIINKPTSRPPGAGEVTSPLDLNCQENCYIVFKLASDWNWQFDPDGNAFTTKVQESKYFNLVHARYVGGKVVKTGPGEAPGEGCKLLYLRARGETNQYDDGFNLVVELNLDPTPTGDKRRTKLVIDPDIRNPGGSEDP